jgi:hypothetical protein
MMFCILMGLGLCKFKKGTSPIILTTKLASGNAKTERKGIPDDFRKAKAEPDYVTSIGIKY